MSLRILSKLLGALYFTLALSALLMATGLRAAELPECSKSEEVQNARILLATTDSIHAHLESASMKLNNLALDVEELGTVESGQEGLAQIVLMQQEIGKIYIHLMAGKPPHDINYWTNTDYREALGQEFVNNSDARLEKLAADLSRLGKLFLIPAKPNLQEIQTYIDEVKTEVDKIDAVYLAADNKARGVIEACIEPKKEAAPETSVEVPAQP